MTLPKIEPPEISPGVWQAIKWFLALAGCFLLWSHVQTRDLANSNHSTVLQLADKLGEIKLDMRELQRDVWRKSELEPINAAPFPERPIRN